jgi:ubiquinone/menaquinone biosynthesis C-methylase UbiE
LNKQNTSHDYARLAGSYSQLGIENTYYLAYRDIPTLIDKYSIGKTALDYGCGAGRSTRFLKELGLDCIGVDINPQMIQAAKEKDKEGKYELLNQSKLPFEDNSFDLVFQAFVSIELPSLTILKEVFAEISRVMKKTGTAIMITASPEGCKGEWASFIYPKNEPRISGAQVELIIRGTDITLYDYVWLPSDYELIFKEVGLNILEKHSPLATGSEPYIWHQELTKPCWDIYVLAQTNR